MKPRGILSVIPISLFLCALLIGPVYAADFLAEKDLKALGVQRYWHTDLPLPANATLAKITLVDDTLYALTDTNTVFAVHSATGVIRWSNIVGDSGQVVRGPTHASQFAFFTTPASVRIMNRQTGEPAGEPRALHGVIIDVVHDSARISIGELHGVRLGDVLNVMRLGTSGEPEKDAIAKLQITAVELRQAKGRLTRLNVARRAMLGDVVAADVVLPLEDVKLPFAASCAAVADDKRVFFGAANQRFYSLDMLRGTQNWQLLTPKTVSSTPVLQGDDLYIAGEDGRVLSLTKVDRTKNWAFETEAPIFADLALDANHVYVACSDRSLYCLDRKTGKRLWRERFDTPLDEPPVVCKGRVYQSVPQQGLCVLEADSGKQLWRHEEGARFLAQLDEDVYLLSSVGGSRLLKVDPATGKQKVAVDGQSVALSAGSQGEQSIIMATRQGELVCLRSEKAPRLTAAQVAEVLRNDAKMKSMATALAEKKAAKATPTSAPAEAKLPAILLDEDWLISRSKVKPVGGHGVPGGEEEKAGKPEKAKAADEMEEETKDESKEATDEDSVSEDEESSKEAAEEEESAESDEGGGDKAGKVNDEEDSDKSKDKEEKEEGDE